MLNKKWCFFRCTNVTAGIHTSYFHVYSVIIVWCIWWIKVFALFKKQGVFRSRTWNITTATLANLMTWPHILSGPCCMLELYSVLHICIAVFFFFIQKVKAEISQCFTIFCSASFYSHKNSENYILIVLGRPNVIKIKTLNSGFFLES